MMRAIRRPEGGVSPPWWAFSHLGTLPLVRVGGGAASVSVLLRTEVLGSRTREQKRSLGALSERGEPPASRDRGGDAERG